MTAFLDGSKLDRYITGEDRKDLEEVIVECPSCEENVPFNECCEECGEPLDDDLESVEDSEEDDDDRKSRMEDAYYDN